MRSLLATLTVLTCAIGLVFRFINLSGVVFWNDEAITALWLSGHDYADVISTALTAREITVADLAQFQRPATDQSLSAIMGLAATGEPQTSPLFLTLLWAWVNRFGDSVATIRGLPAMLSALTLPAMYWLALELFRSRLAAVIAMMLISISPFQIAYAQEARSYSLWTLSILLSTAALLHASARPTRGRWVLYALTTTLSLYSHLLSTLVIAAHVAYIVGVSRARPLADRSALVKQQAAALLAGCALFLPWVVVLARNRSSAYETLDWLSTDAGHRARMISWGGGLIRNFVDFGWSDQDVGQSIGMMLMLVFIGSAVAWLVGVALFRMWCDKPRRLWLLIAWLIASVVPVMILPDLLMGGRRSTIARYLMPGYLAMMLAVASLIATNLASSHRRSQLVGGLLLGAILACGVSSGLFASRADYLWTKSAMGRWCIDVGNAVNRETRPLVIGEVGFADFGNLLALSHRLNPDVRLQLLYHSNDVQVVRDAPTVFLLRPTEPLRENVSRQLNVPFELIDAPSQLWRARTADY